MKRVLLVIMIICLPITSMIVSTNVLFRLPDFYEYAFAKEEQALDAALPVKPDRMSEIISRFMQGRDDEFSLPVEDLGEESEFFSMNEQIVMAGVRGLLNRVTIMGALAAVLLLFACWRLWHEGQHAELRRNWRYSIILFGIMATALGVLREWEASREYLASILLAQRLRSDDTLLLYLTESFAESAFWFCLGISTVLMLVFSYILFRITKPRRMF